MRSLLIFLSLFGLLFSSVGKFSLVVGDVFIQRGEISLKAKTTDNLQNKDKIISKNGKAQIVFSDSTIISLGTNTQLDISNFLNTQNNKKAEFFVPKGSFKVITGQIGKIAPKNFKLKTKTATIGIRGTVFIGDVNKDYQNIGCLDGVINVNIAGKSKTLNKAQMISHDLTSGEIKEKPITSNDFKTLSVPVTPATLAISAISAPKTEDLQKFYTKTTNEKISAKQLKRKYFFKITNGQINSDKANKNISLIILDLNNPYKPKTTSLLCSAIKCAFDKANFSTDDLSEQTNYTSNAGIFTEISLSLKNQATIDTINAVMKDSVNGTNFSAQSIKTPFLQINIPEQEQFQTSKEVIKNLSFASQITYKGVFNAQNIHNMSGDAELTFTEMMPNTVNLAAKLLKKGTTSILIHTNLQSSNKRVFESGSNKIKIDFYGQNAQYIFGKFELDAYKGFLEAKKEGY